MYSVEQKYALTDKPGTYCCLTCGTITILKLCVDGDISVAEENVPFEPLLQDGQFLLIAIYVYIFKTN